MICPSCGTQHAARNHKLGTEYPHRCPVCDIRLTIEIELKPVVKGVSIYAKST